MMGAWSPIGKYINSLISINHVQILQVDLSLLSCNKKVVALQEDMKTKYPRSDVCNQLFGELKVIM